MPANDEKQLIRRCLTGETEAFGKLVDRYQGLLYNTALQMTGDTEEAKDITQTTFIKAFENLKSFKPEHKFFSWIYRILVNESLDTLNRRRNFQALPGNLAATSASPERCRQTRELSRKIEDALRELPFDSRLVLILRHFNEMSYKEISSIVGIGEKTVKSRLYSARHCLAGILTDRGITAHG